MGCNPDAKRLYDDLLSNYNRLIRPVPNNTQKLTVRLGLKLSQLIDVNLKDQVMTTNVWVEQVRAVVYMVTILVGKNPPSIVVSMLLVGGGLLL